MLDVRLTMAHGTDQCTITIGQPLPQDSDETHETKHVRFARDAAALHHALRYHLPAGTWDALLRLMTDAHTADHAPAPALAVTAVLPVRRDRHGRVIH